MPKSTPDSSAPVAHDDVDAPTPFGKVLRIGITLTLVALLLLANLFGEDDHFPFAPFKMYSRSNSMDGFVNSASVYGVNTEGEEFKFTQAGTGIRRAEIEGQRPRFEENPEDLQYLAETYENAQPDKPDVVEVYILITYREIKGGQPTGESSENIVAHWVKDGYTSTIEDDGAQS